MPLAVNNDDALVHVIVLTEGEIETVGLSHIVKVLVFSALSEP